MEQMFIKSAGISLFVERVMPNSQKNCFLSSTLFKSVDADEIAKKIEYNECENIKTFLKRTKVTNEKMKE